MRSSDLFVTRGIQPACHKCLGKDFPFRLEAVLHCPMFLPPKGRKKGKQRRQNYHELSVHCVPGLLKSLPMG